MATSNKDFRVKNGLIVEGTSATVNGEDVLTTASGIDSLANVDTTGVADGNALVYDETNSLWIPGEGGGTGRYTVSDTAPEDPEEGDVWFNSTTGRSYIYYNDGDSFQWVEISSAQGPTGPTGPTGLVGTLNTASDVNISSPTVGQKLAFDGDNWVNFSGYVYADTIYFTSSGEFVKADYPWLRGIRVRVVGGGGHGPVTGFSSLSGDVGSGSSGGGGGGYAESFIADIAVLDASVTVTRGAGGVRIGNVPASASSFGSLVVGNAGVSGVTAPNSVTNGFVQGGAGGSGTGQLVIGGQSGENWVAINGFTSNMPVGGDSHLGSGGGVELGFTAGTGLPGVGFGSGGGGGFQKNSNIASFGGNGANGIVIVDLFA